MVMGWSIAFTFLRGLLLLPPCLASLAASCFSIGVLGLIFAHQRWHPFLLLATNPPSPSSSPVGLESTRIAEPPQSEREMFSSTNHSTSSSSTQNPLQSNSQLNHPFSNPTTTKPSQPPSDTPSPSPPTPQPPAPPPSQPAQPQSDTEMQSRIWGTAAAVTACIQGGADIVRVHDWEEMSKVVRMADAVWRV